MCTMYRKVGYVALCLLRSSRFKARIFGYVRCLQMDLQEFLEPILVVCGDLFTSFAVKFLLQIQR